MSAVASEQSGLTPPTPAPRTGCDRGSQSCGLRWPPAPWLSWSVDGGSPIPRCFWSHRRSRRPWTCRPVTCTPSRSRSSTRAWIARHRHLPAHRARRGAERRRRPAGAEDLPPGPRPSGRLGRRVDRRGQAVGVLQAARPGRWCAVRPRLGRETAVTGHPDHHADAAWRREDQGAQCQLPALGTARAQRESSARTCARSTPSRSRSAAVRTWPAMSMVRTRRTVGSLLAGPASRGVRDE